MLGSMDSCLPPKGERISLRRPLRQLSLGQDPLPASPLISTRNLIPGLSESVVQLDMLGKGATSNVFLAIHAATLKMVALKEVTVSTDADRRAVRTEMRALKTQRSPLLNSTFTTDLASCPRIVDYYGSVVRENGNACIAVEYVAGGSLENWLENSGSSVCPEPWFAHIAHQALEALDFVHSGGGVHRDIKPANLLITRNGDLKLGDFGAAGVENSSRMIGTQRFMAPERLKGRRATAQSDLWSLGTSLATAALGNDFISLGCTQFEQLDRAGRVRRTLAKSTTLSKELNSFLHACLSRDPARRPPLRELMKHEFLEQRHDWQTKCPELAQSMRDGKRLRSRDPNAMSTEQVLDALCRVRAEENLIGSNFDPATAADLAFELGVTPKSLVRNVHRLTLEYIRERGGGGGLSGVSDSGGENGDGDEAGGGSGRSRRGAAGGGDRKPTTVNGGGIASDEVRRRRARHAARETGGDRGDEEGKGGGRSGPEEGQRNASRSPRRELPPPSPEDGLKLVADADSTAIVDGGDVDVDIDVDIDVDSSSSRSNSTAFPMVTPRATGTVPFGRQNSTASTKRNRRRAMEMTSAVKLTPHKRRGERKASQTKRNGSHCAADGTARRSGGRRERERQHRASGMERDAPELGCEEEGVTAADVVVEETAAVVVPAKETRAPTGSATEGGGGGGGGGISCIKDDIGHTAACRRSRERKAKKDKPRTAASRTLPSRSDVCMRSVRVLFQLADEMKAQIAVRNRVHRLQVYPNCFSGREAVQWMLDGCHASSVKEAEKIGNEMMKHSVFQHILNSETFEDSSVYYQFTDGEIPPPPPRGSRRLRQIARVLTGSVARRLVHSHGSSGGGAPVVVVQSGSGGGKAMSAATGRGDCICSAATSLDSSARSSFSRQRKQQQQQQQASITKAKRRSRGRGTSSSVSQLRRFSSSVSTLTVPETPY